MEGREKEIERALIVRDVKKVFEEAINEIKLSKELSEVFEKAAVFDRMDEFLTEKGKAGFGSCRFLNIKETRIEAIFKGLVIEELERKEQEREEGKIHIRRMEDILTYEEEPESSKLTLKVPLDFVREVDYGERVKILDPSGYTLTAKVKEAQIVEYKEGKATAVSVVLTDLVRKRYN
jgi:hypothetical protein